MLLQTPAPVLLLSNLISAEEALRLTATLRSATPGVVVALVVTFFYERSKDAAYAYSQEELACRLETAVRVVVQQDDMTRMQRYLDAVSPSEVIRAALARAHRGAERIDALVDLVEPDGGPSRDIDVQVVIRDTDGPEAFAIDITTSTTMENISEIVVAFTSNIGMGTRLWQSAPRITQIHVFESARGAHDAAQTAISDPNAVQYLVEIGGRTGPLQHSSLELVRADEYEQYDIPEADDSDEHPILLRKELAASPGAKVTHIITSSGIAARTSRFSYYSMDRLSYVRRISFDWSGFNEERFNPRIIPFFSPRNSLPPIGPVTRRVSIVVEQWLARGAGIILIW